MRREAAEISPALLAGGGEISRLTPHASRLSPILVIGIGNPSRGDDALGPLLIDRLAAMELTDVELLTDFQLQVEYVLDLAGRRQVIFVDASVSEPEPFAFRALQPSRDASHSSHALSPAALLASCDQVGVKPPAQSFVLAIRGYRFELGEPLSEEAGDNLAAASDFLVRHLRTM